MVHWNVENGQITPLQIAENINKMSKVLLKPSLLWGIIKCNFVTLSWAHSLSELTALFYMRKNDVTIWTNYITHSGLCWIPIAIFRYGLTLFVYLPPVVIFPLFWHFEWDTLINDTFYKCLFDFYIFSVTFEHKNWKNSHIFWEHFSVYVSDLGRQRTFCMLTRRLFWSKIGDKFT